MRWGMWMSSSRIWWPELVVPPPWTTHAYKCDIISATAEPGILVCCRCHTNIRQGWGYPEYLCGRILHFNQQMLGLHEAMTTGSVVIRVHVHGPNTGTCQEIKENPKERKGKERATTIMMLLNLVTPVLFHPCHHIISTHRVWVSYGNKNVHRLDCLFEYELFTDVDFRAEQLHEKIPLIIHWRGEFSC